MQSLNRKLKRHGWPEGGWTSRFGEVKKIRKVPRSNEYVQVIGHYDTVVNKFIIEKRILHIRKLMY